jgi:Mce-associated membrane protein
MSTEDDRTPDQAEESTTAAESSPAAPPPYVLPSAQPAGTGRGRWIERGVAAVVVVAALVVAGLSLWKYTDNRSLADARQDAQNAACAYAPKLFTYDSKNIQQYFDSVLAGATGDFKKDFADTTTNSDLRNAVTQGDVVSKAGQTQCALESGDKSHAEVIAVVGKSVSSVGTKGQAIQGQQTVVLSLRKTDGHWLVDKLTMPLAPEQ